MARIDSLRFTLSGSTSPVLFARLRAHLALARQRRALARLDADALRDIGLSVEQAQTEARRPLWDAPAHWR